MSPNNASDLPPESPLGASFGPQPLGWLDEIEPGAALPGTRGNAGAGAGPNPGVAADAVAVLEARLADTEQRRIAAEVRLRTLEEELARFACETRERQALERRIERLRHEVALERARNQETERELSESRFRLADQESSLGALREADRQRRAAEEENRAYEELVELLAARLEQVVDQSRPITRAGLRRLVEALQRTPEAALEAVRAEIEG